MNGLRQMIDISVCPDGMHFMEDKWWHSKRSNVWNRGKMVNHRLKTFGVLSGTFRHDRACAVFTQLSFQVGSKKPFSVENYDQEWMDEARVPLLPGPPDAYDDANL